MDETIMKLQVADDNFIDPGFIAHAGARFPYALQSVFGKLAGADLLRQLAGDDDSGRAGIEKQSDGRTIIQPNADTITAPRHTCPHRQQLQFDLRTLYFAGGYPGLASGKGLDELGKFV